MYKYMVQKLTDSGWTNYCGLYTSVDTARYVLIRAAEDTHTGIDSFRIIDVSTHYKKGTK